MAWIIQPIAWKFKCMSIRCGGVRKFCINLNPEIGHMPMPFFFFYFLRDYKYDSLENGGENL